MKITVKIRRFNLVNTMFLTTEETLVVNETY